MPGKLGYMPQLVQDLTFTQVNGRLAMHLIIKKSKTTTHGFTATIGCSDNLLCVVCSTTKYLAGRGIKNTLGVK